MEGRIAHLRSHYRLVGAQLPAPAVASRLDKLLLNDVIQNCDEALQSALSGDESVYVLRRVKSRTSIVLGDATDAGLAKSWGSHLAAAVMRAIAREDDEPDNVVRFRNQADYVASFIVALLKGSEHGQWFYVAFRELQTLDTKIAIRRVLLDNISSAPAILAYVHQYGQLDSLLAALDAETRQALWSPESEARDDREITRSLFTAALQFIDKTGGWRGPAQEREGLFRRYWETGPPFADWRDPRSLAEAVLEIVRYFFARGYFSMSHDDELSLRLGAALEDFEWLDREWLRSSVLELIDKQDRAMPDLPLRVSSGRATPRQRELLAAIDGAVGDAKIAPGGDPLAASLKILALLVNASPGWAEDAAAKVMIENVLAAASAVLDTPQRGELLKRLRRRDVEGAMRLLPLERRERVGDACRAVAALGEPALELLEKLTNTDAKPLSGGVASECAGLALLLRPMLDARLHAFAGDASSVKGEMPPVVMLFILVAYRIFGGRAFVNEELEPALCLLAGIERAPTFCELQAVWRETETMDLHQSLRQMAEGHRLIEPDQDLASITGELGAVEEGQTGYPQLDQTIAILACLLLRMWSRWLRGFSDSSLAFIVDNFIRRQGRLYSEKDVILVELERRPLDLVMEMAGYLADLERVPWLPGKRIKFSFKGS